MRAPKSHLWRSWAPVIVWITLSMVPGPSSLAVSSWLYFALFAAVIVAVILEPIPASAAGLIGVTLATSTGLVSTDPRESISWALQGFSNNTVWLIFGAFMLSMGYEKTGLGRRIALHLVRRLGKRTLGLGYAAVLADLALAPGTPSNTARSGGTIFPILSNIPRLFGSEPGPTARLIGSYLMWTAFSATAITSALFLTALAPNLLAVSLVRQTTGLEIDWTQWLIGIAPVAFPLLIALPLLIYYLHPPTIKKSPEAPRWARSELEKMGSIRRQEVFMGALVFLALAMWILARHILSPTTVVLVVLCLMVLLKVVEWEDVVSNKSAWNVLVWFATLVTLADGLNQVGFNQWLARKVAEGLSGFSPYTVMTGMVVFFFLVHYGFASLTAHTASLLPVMLAIGALVPGMPLLPFSLLLCYSLGLMGVITPYATGPAPLYYSSGFVGRADFWRLGLLVGLIYLGTLVLIGAPWLVFLHGR